MELVLFSFACVLFTTPLEIESWFSIYLRKLVRMFGHVIFNFLIEITSSKENSRSSTSKQSDGKTSRKSKRTVAQRQQSTHVEVDITSEHTKKPRTKKNVVSTNKGSDDVVSKVTTQRVRKSQKVLEGVTVPVHVESSTRGRDDEKRTSKKKAVYKPSTKIKKGRRA